MSTSRSRARRADDHIVTALSQWLGRHASDAQLRRTLETAEVDALAPGQRAAVDELLGLLRNREPGRRGDLEMLVRETLEALALG